MIEKLQGQRASWKTVERTVAEGDRVDGGFRGDYRRTTFRRRARGKASRSSSVPGQVLPGLRSCAARHGSRRERDGNRAVSAGLPYEKLGRQDGRVRHRRAQSSKSGNSRRSMTSSPQASVSAGGAGALRGEVRNNMERELKERLRAETKTRVFDALVAANRITVPRALVDQGDRRVAGSGLAPDGAAVTRAKHPARERFEATGSAPRDGWAPDPRARSRTQDQARSGARRATREGARRAVREARGSRAVLSQRSWHDGSGRSGRARGSGRRFPADAQANRTTKSLSFKDFMGA